MGLQMLRKAVLLLLLTSLACTDASRYMSTDDGARHRLWPLPMARPFHSQDDTAIRIWPMPLQVSRGNVSMSVSPHLEISVSVAGLRESVSSFVIANAFHRYKHIIFSHGESQFNLHDSTVLLLNSELYLEKLIVNVSSDDDTLDFDTDESYHLYIPSDLTEEQAYLQLLENVDFRGRRNSSRLNVIVHWYDLCVLNPINHGSDALPHQGVKLKVRTIALQREIRNAKQRKQYMSRVYCG
ncbi:hypothetical protein L7F22_006246 [Adiantum nelumboides]|nr:hypothetical protein [Adiantum nelumboides]